MKYLYLGAITQSAWLCGDLTECKVLLDVA